MSIYAVDVKAFINVVIDADNAERAQELADAFVSSLSPSAEYICGYNGMQSEGTIDPDNTGGFEIDGDSDVDEADWLEETD